MNNLSLLKQSNPLLFTPERYDEYPLDPIELAQFLNKSLEKDSNNNILLRERPFTSVDQLDYLFYLDSDTQELDLDKKLAIEYALFQLQLLKQAEAIDSDNNNNNKRINKTSNNDFYNAVKDDDHDGLSYFESLQNSDFKSLNGLKKLLFTLNKVNGLDLDLNRLNHLESQIHYKNSSANINAANTITTTSSRTGITNDSNISNDSLHKTIKNFDLNDENSNENFIDNACTNSSDDNIQELTSYLLSNTIKKGIDLRPKGEMNDSTQFLKNCIDSLIEVIITNRTNSSVSQIEVSSSNNHNNNSKDTDKDKDEPNTSMDSKCKELETKLAEMTTAFNDLQLAHNFLTKQYENDHNDSMKNIEKLTRTNKELQEKILKYHSILSKREDYNKIHETDDNNQSNTINKDNENSIFHSSNKSFTSPILGHREIWTPQTPSSNKNSISTINNTINSPSLSMMKNEFRRLLTETQRKYEKEIDQERQIRKQLQYELNLVKK